MISTEAAFYGQLLFLQEVYFLATYSSGYERKWMNANCENQKL